MNSAVLSCKLTNQTKTAKVNDKDQCRRLATYEFYDGKSKAMQPSTVVLVGWGKTAELLEKAPAEKEVVVEGQLQILVKDRTDGGKGKNRLLELSINKLHFV